MSKSSNSAFSRAKSGYLHVALSFSPAQLQREIQFKAIAIHGSAIRSGHLGASSRWTAPAPSPLPILPSYLAAQIREEPRCPNRPALHQITAPAGARGQHPAHPALLLVGLTHLHGTGRKHPGSLECLDLGCGTPSMSWSPSPTATPVEMILNMETELRNRRNQGPGRLAAKQNEKSPCLLCVLHFPHAGL